MSINLLRAVPWISKGRRCSPKNVLNMHIPRGDGLITLHWTTFSRNLYFLQSLSYLWTWIHLSIKRWICNESCNLIQLSIRVINQIENENNLIHAYNIIWRSVTGLMIWFKSVLTTRSRMSNSDPSNLWHSLINIITLQTVTLRMRILVHYMLNLPLKTQIPLSFIDGKIIDVTKSYFIFTIRCICSLTIINRMYFNVLSKVPSTYVAK